MNKDIEKLKGKFDELKKLVEQDEPEPEPEEPTDRDTTPSEAGPRSEQERFVAHFGMGPEGEDRTEEATGWADRIVEAFVDDAETFFTFILPPRGTGGEELPPEEDKTEEKKTEKKNEDKK